MSIARPAARGRRREYSGASRCQGEVRSVAGDRRYVLVMCTRLDLGGLLAHPSAAHADEALITARLPVGPDAAAPGLGGSVDGGWGGAHAQPIGALSAEA